MYVTDGWGSVYAIDVTNGKKAHDQVEVRPRTDSAWAGDVACCGVNNRGVALWKDKVISISLDGRLFAVEQGDRRDAVGAQDRRPRHRRDAHARAAGRSATSPSSASPAANTASAA